MAHNTPNELKYTKEHEWIKIENNTAFVGITDFAQSSLGDIVYVELPEVGIEVSQNDTFGVVESIKSVSDLYVPLSGKVVEVNESLGDSPEQINQNPYENWMIKIELSNTSECDALLSSDSYSELCQN